MANVIWVSVSVKKQGCIIKSNQIISIKSDEFFHNILQKVYQSEEENIEVSFM